MPKRLSDEAVPHVFAVDLSNVCSSVIACRETSDMWMVMWFFQPQRLSTDICTSAVDLAAGRSTAVGRVSVTTRATATAEENCDWPKPRHRRDKNRRDMLTPQHARCLKQCHDLHALGFPNFSVLMRTGAVQKPRRMSIRGVF